MASNNSMQTPLVMLNDGYDVPLVGLDNGMFYFIQIPAVVCLVMSFICALSTIISSFWSHPAGEFYARWTRGERLVVYMSICDLLSSISLLVNHLQVLITKMHARPKGLCAFFGVITTEFMLAQILMVNVVAINIFAMMFFNTKISFGKFDSGILVWSFGVPFIGALIAALLEQFGPMVLVCHFDAVNGKVGGLVLITIPLTTIMVVNVLLYILTFIKIRIEVIAARECLGKMTSTAHRHIRAARNMSMFVVSLFVQWSIIALVGTWVMFGDKSSRLPEILYFFIIVLTNIGGVLNLIVYLAIFKKTKLTSKMATDMESRKTHSFSDNNKTPAYGSGQGNEEFEFN
ncbi:hypothetical protein MAR_031439 [Mya arenaria]|uniref:G-protein coupled receptors family 1 profile domain-containing protein n=1 Tax=Mya arenaria TaxID=6604 RepID=A0ABY7F3W9_MYAAR|nr:hypothetical protein MAR_031439 [Mya arenaria]